MMGARTQSLESGFTAAERLAGMWYVAGEMRRAGHTFSVANDSIVGPERVVARISPAEAVTALTAAAEAQKQWAETPVPDRIAFVRGAGDVLREREREIVELIVVESGKAIRYATYEVSYALVVLEAMCDAMQSFTGIATQDSASGRSVEVANRPVGPSLLITPWNFPLSLGLRKVVTALLAGCTAMLKPSDQTPLTSVAIGEAFRDVGLPPHVLSVIPTNDSVQVVDALVGDAALRKLSFTGSTRVGRQLERRAADQLLRTTLELGGNAPFILGMETPLESVLEPILTAKFANSGQACTALNRLLVPEHRSSDLVEQLGAAVARVNVGDPTLQATEVGPLISVEAASNVRRLVDGAREDGARVDLCGHSEDLSGAWIAPAVVSGLRPDSDLASTEVFGPVLSVIEYKDSDDALRIANGTPYGLAAYVGSADPIEVDYLASRLEAGMIAVNSGSVSAASSPFGGTKWSGHGRENGLWGLSEFTESVAVLR